MQSRYRFLVFVLLIIACPLKAQSHNSEEDASYLINDIVIFGLKRTKKHVVETPLKRFIGQNAAEIDFNDIRAIIIETGILEPLSIETEDDPKKQGKILKIEVHEKWSIFPLPIFFANSDSIGGGLGFMDLNALGINDKFMFGGMIDSDGWLAATAYIHTPGTSSSLGWNITLFYSKQDRADRDEKDNDIRRFGLKRFFASMGLSYKINEPVVAVLNLSFTDAKIYDIDNSLAVPIDDGSAISLNPELRIQKNSWDGFFLSQRSIEMGYTYSLGIGYPSFHKIDIQTNLQQSLVPGFRMFIRAGMIYAPEAPPLFESRPRAINISILPQSFSAQNFIGSSAGLEKYIYKGSFGTLSILSSYQIVYSDGPILGERIDHGVLGSMQFYLRRIAIPAVGMGVSYNATAKYLQGAFNIGMSF